MENHQEKETFSYTYSARQQEEIKNIRKKYLAPEEDKMEQLRRLHNSATQKAQAWALVLGVIGVLFLGLGMSLAMTDLSALLGGAAMFAGIFVGLIGIVLTTLAYPAYNHILKRERRRIAPEILRLSDELMK